MDSLQLLVVTDDGTGDIYSAFSSDGKSKSWKHVSGKNGATKSGFISTGHATQGWPSLVAIPTGDGYGAFTMAALGSNNDYKLYSRTSSDGANWSSNNFTGQTSSYPPALMSYSPSIPALGGDSWMGSGTYGPASFGGGALSVCPSSGDVWSPDVVQANQTSKCPPALIQWYNSSVGDVANYSVMAFVSLDSSNRLLACNTAKGGSWSGANFTGQYSPYGPLITSAGYSGFLYMAFLSNDSDEILVCSSSDGINWSKAIHTGQSTRAAPSITTFNGELAIAFIALHSNDVLVSTSYRSGAAWSVAYPTGIGSLVSPAMASFNFKPLPIL